MCFIFCFFVAPNLQCVRLKPINQVYIPSSYIVCCIYYLTDGKICSPFYEWSVSHFQIVCVCFFFFSQYWLLLLLLQCRFFIFVCNFFEARKYKLFFLFDLVENFLRSEKWSWYQRTYNYFMWHKMNMKQQQNKHTQIKQNNNKNKTKKK